MPKFLPETERAIKEAFSFFADSSGETISEGQLLPAIRALGLPITERQMGEVSAELRVKSMKYDTFVELLMKVVHKRKPETLSDEIRKAFEALKDDSGLVLKKYLQNLLENTGEKLTAEEFPGEELTYADFKEIVEIPQALDFTILPS